MQRIAKGNKYFTEAVPIISRLQIRAIIATTSNITPLNKLCLLIR